MRLNKGLNILILSINIIGILCLCYFAVPFITHDTHVANPEAMLPMENWDGSGVVLTIGFVPLLVANILAFLCIAKEKIKLPMRVLYFVPSLICILLVLGYWSM